MQSVAPIQVCSPLHDGNGHQTVAFQMGIDYDALMAYRPAWFRSRFSTIVSQAAHLKWTTAAIQMQMSLAERNEGAAPLSDHRS